MGAYVIDLMEADVTMRLIAGGKAANLGELTKIRDIHIPEGFCVTTEAFKTVAQNCAELQSLLRLLRSYNRDWIGEVCDKIRNAIESAAIPMAIRDEISNHISRLGEQGAYAVRSSATTEDWPAASFAGQHDTYLNIIGLDAILKHISMCWASLFSERAVVYRIENGIDHGAALMAVAVQKMVFPDAAGIMFTADPVTSNRKIISVDAGYGLGDAMVSGLINADNYTVREGTIVSKRISIDRQIT
jgi:pyruvate,water dikinase